MRYVSYALLAPALVACRGDPPDSDAECRVFERLDWEENRRPEHRLPGPGCVDIGGLLFPDLIWIPCDAGNCGMAGFVGKSRDGADVETAWARFEHYWTVSRGAGEPAVKALRPGPPEPDGTTFPAASYTWASPEWQVNALRVSSGIAVGSLNLWSKARGTPAHVGPDHVWMRDPGDWEKRLPLVRPGPPADLWSDEDAPP